MVERKGHSAEQIGSPPAGMPFQNQEPIAPEKEFFQKRVDKGDVEGYIDKIPGGDPHPLGQIGGDMGKINEIPGQKIARQNHPIDPDPQRQRPQKPLFLKEKQRPKGLSFLPVAQKKRHGKQEEKGQLQQGFYKISGPHHGVDHPGQKGARRHRQHNISAFSVHLLSLPSQKAWCLLYHRTRPYATLPAGSGATPPCNFREICYDIEKHHF